ncbi:hypothetical protein I3U42_01265 [Mycobacteroides abscessus subsp. abscessus]|uniref:hypothetical protein n=1 Tax=Mycobacteroides abscessus TaxID=36809 RepID=UPI0019D00445|nr:hypothetical protein [Mycobacteroides abscessus]QSN26466.1 hypothetical protein I3U36_01265 [Mycobacteroides abscessus subsp. abscessus]QSN31723.1 hypothetical protein I3U42_01265 [Mycobacteroides abscessus subsp. abscessus]QST89436.1 hypothetical protein PROPHIGD43A-5_27 [Mycobacterium phage prophiGD43A-5]
MKIIDTQRQWATVCIDCPADGNNPDDGKTWEFPGTDDGKERAEAFAARHNSLQGHRAHVNEQYTVTAARFDDGPGYLAAGDVEDSGASIGECVHLPTVFTGRPAVYFLADCQQCDGKPIPFGTEDDRDLWTDGHHKATGHNVTPSVEVRPDQGQ